jgi:glycogen synthase
VKVVMTADAVGGVWTYACELAEGLALEGVEVVLAVTGRAPDAGQRRRLRMLPLARWEHRPYELEWADRPWADVERTGEWLRELVASETPDLLHLNAYSNAAIDLSCPKLVVGHSCVLSWHAAVRRRAAGADWNRYRLAVTEGLAGADAVVAPTRAMLVELERLYRPTCPRFVIPNGVDTASIRPLPKANYVLGAGRVWDEAKNLELLQRVGEKLPWPVVIAGEGGPLGRVSHDRLVSLYGRAAVFCAPARYEPFGLAVLEAGLAGCALVLGDLPSLREVWSGAALHVDPFDEEAVEHALLRVTCDRGARLRLAAAARRRALSYSRERMTAAYLNLYRELVHERSGKRQRPLAVAR